MGKKLLIDKQFVKCDFEIQDISGARWGASNVNDLSFLTPGKKYTLQLTYDDSDLVETFDYLCNDYVLQGEHIYGLGNPCCLDGLEDNGEPLSFMYAPSYKESITAWNIGSWEENKGFTFYVSIFGEGDIMDSSVSFGSFLANPKYRFCAFQGLFGWLLTRKKAPILPEGYTQQEYIESDGLYCIDTGYCPNQNTGFYADFIPYNAISGEEGVYGSVFGGRQSSRLNEFQVTTYSSSPDSYQGIFRYGKDEYNPALQTGVRTVATFRNGAYSSSLGREFTVKPVEFTSPVPMTIFAVNNGGQIGQCGRVRLFAFKLYDGDTLVRNFVPCRNPNGQSGLWDLVAKQFYGFRAPASSYDVGFSESEGPSAG